MGSQDAKLRLLSSLLSDAIGMRKLAAECKWMYGLKKVVIEVSAAEITLSPSHTAGINSIRIKIWACS
ncbi:MAG TPA: hypothetical protein VEH06_15425 [Candidatus Bathyarchaeia archaeon]|jgi:hypothetical protein|nr:hypothetical protein [Candidatus Bathyarchaeia archaeon]